MSATAKLLPQEGRQHPRRIEYKPSVPSETFIVPLLALHINRFLSSLTPQPGLKALDVGCGSQPFRALIEDRGYSYFGMDAIDNPSCAIDFVSPIDAEPPDNLVLAGPFDLIICTEVLEHVANWERAFQNLALLLAADGKILITCPHFYPLHEEPFDFWRPTQHAITHFANANGLSVHDSRTLGSALDVLGTLLGNIYFTRSTPGLSTFLSYWSCKAMRRLFFFVLKHRVLQDRVQSTGCYLANLAVLTRGTPASQ